MYGDSLKINSFWLQSLYDIFYYVVGQIGILSDKGAQGHPYSTWSFKARKETGLMFELLVT